MLLIGLLLFTQSKVFAQNAKLFLGVKLHADVQAIAEEIESKTKRKIYAEYVEFAKDEHLLGSSYFTSNGTPILRVNVNLMEQSQKVEAVVAHELYICACEQTTFRFSCLPRLLRPNGA
jgi:hypothetical protein